MSFLLRPSSGQSRVKRERFQQSQINELRNKVLSECKVFSEAYEKTQEIWAAINIANYKKEGVLNRAAVEIFFNSQRVNLRELLLVKSADELIELLDEDEDGFLNQREQILIFYLIKHRMQNIADDLCRVFEYDLYDNLLKAIVKLEADIIEYHKTLSENMNTRELECLLRVKDEADNQFKDLWDEKFNKLKKEREICFCELKNRQIEERKNLMEKVLKDNSIHLKPVSSLKTMKTYEKLIAIDGRVTESKKLKKELDLLERSEIVRLNLSKHQLDQNKFKKLELRHQSELNYFHTTHDAEQLELLQEYNTEKSRMEKINKIKISEFVKNQRFSNAYIEEKIRTHNEILRSKHNYTKKKLVLQTSSLDISLLEPRRAPSSTQNMSFNSGHSQINLRQGMLKDLHIKINSISHVSLNPTSINKKLSTIMNKNNATMLETMKKIEEIKSKSMPSVSALYNHRLEPINSDQLYPN